MHFCLPYDVVSTHRIVKLEIEKFNGSSVVWILLYTTAEDKVNKDGSMATLYKEIIVDNKKLDEIENSYCINDSESTFRLL